MALENHIPWEDFGGEGQTVHFAHANGYPPGAYRTLLVSLGTQYHVVAMRSRPLWPTSDPQVLQDWRPLADDLARFLDEQHLHNLVGIGHSMGATTTLRLALRQPERFRALVLIDPVIFPPLVIHLWKLLYRLGLGYPLHPLARRALQRRRFFENKQSMFANYRTKPVFRRLDDDSLHAYTNAIAYQLPDGQVGLAYPPEWEARVYVTGLLADFELWDNLPSLRPPMLLLRGAQTNTFWRSTARLLQHWVPKTQGLSIPDTSHLLPMEKPQLVYNAITKFLDKGLP